MSPEFQKRFDDMERKVNAMYEVQDVAFIGNIERRVVGTVKTEASQDPSSISKGVAESGSASYSVAKVFDGKVPFYLSDGTKKFIGVYDS